MKNWTSEGHLTDGALELHAAGEAPNLETKRANDHLQSCPSCHARLEEWRELFHALSSLPTLEPSPSFDRMVLERVRAPAQTQAPGSAWLPSLTRRLRPLAVATTAVWSAAVLVGVAWVGVFVEASGAAVMEKVLAYFGDAAWSTVIRIGALLEITGMLEWWAEVTRIVPGPGILSAVALMTGFAGLALWGLYRVTGYQPTRVNANV